MDGATWVASINGASQDKTSSKKPWLAMYTDICLLAPAPYCCAGGCMKNAEVGGHLWRFDAASRKFDMQHAYIGPVCKTHNSREFDYPKLGFKMKENTWLMRMLPHECYADYKMASDLAARQI